MTSWGDKQNYLSVASGELQYFQVWQILRYLQKTYMQPQHVNALKRKQQHEINKINVHMCLTTQNQLSLTWLLSHFPQLSSYQLTHKTTIFLQWVTFNLYLSASLRLHHDTSLCLCLFLKSHIHVWILVPVVLRKIVLDVWIKGQKTLACVQLDCRISSAAPLKGFQVPPQRFATSSDRSWVLHQQIERNEIGI